MSEDEIHSIEQPPTEHLKLNEKPTIMQHHLNAILDTLEDMWTQFAYRKANGQLDPGGLSALEDCQAILHKYGRLPQEPQDVPRP